VNDADRSSADPRRFPTGTPGSVGSRKDNAQGGSTGGALSCPLAISLPKSGGAIRGIGERFSANPVTGSLRGISLSRAHESNLTDESRSANRYLKHIKYGNHPTRQSGEDLTQRSDWLFEVVLDYGERAPNMPTPNNSGEWLCRHDPFPSYRAGFEVRTYRLCQLTVMFHHFPDEEGMGNVCLVRSTDFVYRSIRENDEDLKKGHPIASFIAWITQCGYKRLPNGGYLKTSLPPLEFEHSQATIRAAKGNLVVRRVRRATGSSSASTVAVQRRALEKTAPHDE
jgi:hypothetical protein